MRSSLPLAFALALLSIASVAPSRAAAAEIRGHLEGGGAHFLGIGGAWQGREIGVGVVGAGALEIAPSPRFGIEGRVLGGRFLRGSPPSDASLRGVDETGLFGLSVGFRWHPVWDARGPWIGSSFGGIRTGSVTRASFDARIGWDFRLGGYVRGGPFAGYLHVLQPDSEPLRPEDGRAAVFGLHGAFDETHVPPRARRTEAAKPPAVVMGPPPETRCAPGLEPDPRFGDAHGCLDPLDVPGLRLPDRCPDEPEDFVGASDADGCPTNAEVKVVGDEIVLNDRVYFDFGLARVKHRSWPLLKSLAKLILAHPEYAVVHIHGHTDEIGDDVWNQKLSEQRAAAVRKKLIEYGVPAARLVSKGFGKSKPRAKGKDEAARQENRRVEFLIERKLAGKKP